MTSGTRCAIQPLERKHIRAGQSPTHPAAKEIEKGLRHPAAAPAWIYGIHVNTLIIVSLVVINVANHNRHRTEFLDLRGTIADSV